MKIIQALPTIAYGDAVSNDAIAVSRILQEKGVLTRIYAENIGKKVSVGTARKAEMMPYLRDEDILIYHASTGSELNEKVAKHGGKLVVWYHNITPPEYFEGYSYNAYHLVLRGYEGISALSRHAYHAIADSEYNRQCLLEMGYRCPIDVVPIAIPWDDYDQPDDLGVKQQYGAGDRKNILFVGRIAPNKKHENLIRAFYYYTINYNPEARLILCGSEKGFELYKEHLENYAARLGIGDRVIFPGHISFRALLTFYKTADLLLCMSEHEGFCVPVVEAMHFGVPIVAYRSTAVGETLGEGGLLLETRDPLMAAAAMNRVLTDENLRAHIRAGQQKEIARFRYDTVSRQMMEILEKL